MRNILLIGGSGQLGRKVINKFIGNKIVNVDFKKNDDAQINIYVKPELTHKQNNLNTIQAVKQLNVKFNAVIVTAGSWTQGSIKDEDYFQKLKLMNQANLYPSLLAAHLAYKYLNPGGLVVFTGAASAFKQPLPDSLAYALSKTAVHSLAMNLAEKAHEFQGRVVTILPETIDTQTNREAMPNSDFSKWSSPDQIGQLLKGWSDGLNVPNNGSFALLGVKNGCIKVDYV